ncbi:hypothetical protein DFJ74DRAFT_296299 [Hyaloraphidium curvatum]|nr:hypothetical protein DFJ74DRAFT_296299 [Hyaloraphidium curvatum]
MSLPSVLSAAGPPEPRYPLDEPPPLPVRPPPPLRPAGILPRTCHTSSPLGIEVPLHRRRLDRAELPPAVRQHPEAARGGVDVDHRRAPPFLQAQRERSVGGGALEEGDQLVPRKGKEPRAGPARDRDALLQGGRKPLRPVLGPDVDHRQIRKAGRGGRGNAMEHVAQRCSGPVVRPARFGGGSVGFVPQRDAPTRAGVRQREHRAAAFGGPAREAVREAEIAVVKLHPSSTASRSAPPSRSSSLRRSFSPARGRRLQPQHLSATHSSLSSTHIVTWLSSGRPVCAPASASMVSWSDSRGFSALAAARSASVSRRIAVRFAVAAPSPLACSATPRNDGVVMALTGSKVRPPSRSPRLLAIICRQQCAVERGRKTALAPFDRGSPRRRALEVYV